MFPVNADLLVVTASAPTSDSTTHGNGHAAEASQPRNATALQVDNNTEIYTIIARDPIPFFGHLITE